MKRKYIWNDYADMMTFRKPHRVSSVAAYLATAATEILIWPTEPRPDVAIMGPIVMGGLAGGVVHLAGSAIVAGARMLARAYDEPKGPN